MTTDPNSAGDLVIDTADGSFSAYLSRPSGAEAAPAVIVLQEIFGINTYIRGVCDRLAAQGFIAAAPDLFWRQEPGVQLAESERERAVALMQGLDGVKALADCKLLLDRLRTLPGSSGKVGAVGYCLGGRFAYLLAAHSPIDAAVSYYGVGIQNALSDATAIRAPLLLHIAEQDTLCPPDAQQAIIAAVSGQAGTRVETYSAGHAFARTGSAAYHAESAERADARTIEFLKANL